MALTFSEKARGSMGGRAFRCVEVTHDDSATTVEASNLGLNYIEAAWFSLGALTSAPAATVTITNSNTYITFSEALKTASVATICAIGY